MPRQLHITRYLCACINIKSFHYIQSSKKPKHGNHSDQTAEDVGGVDDVSLRGDDPSTRSRSSSSSSQSDFLALGDDVSSLSLSGDDSSLSEIKSSFHYNHSEGDHQG